MGWTVKSTQVYKNKGKKTDMPFEELDYQSPDVHYIYVCIKPAKK